MLGPPADEDDEVVVVAAEEAEAEADFESFSLRNTAVGVNFEFFSSFSASVTESESVPCSEE